MKKTLGMVLGFAVLAAGCTKDDIDTNKNKKTSSVSQQNKAQNKDDQCDKSRWDEETKTWVCDEKSSSNYNHHYHGGSYFPTTAALMGSMAYQNYRNSSNFATATPANTAKPVSRITTNPNTTTKTAPVSPNNNSNSKVSLSKSGGSSSGFSSGSRGGASS
ncbi:hypothetical protein [Bacillus cereus]|uniref:Lipoprotein n=1 Tax=Bacillus cereus TaxID=1396 RepID=A0A164NZN3_BACCE|nr:hypothetical protein [Bacillus cereus]KZD66029.1 hypothetical protein B4088_2786 [Bacillus cereus]